MDDRERERERVTYVRKRACVHLCGKEKGRKVYMRERERERDGKEGKRVCMRVR